MINKIYYEQAFYGSGINGYQVLKNSAPQYDSIIEKICGAVGTPDGFSKMSPFLINYPHGDMIFMARCISGAPDRYNRKTLFFHVIYGSVQKNIDGNINIFTLLRDGAFLDKEPDFCTKTVVATHEMPQHFSGNTPFAWNRNPLAIQCDSPQNELLEKLLGKEVNNYAWASFSFAPLPNFKLYAISEYSSTPVGIDCCDMTGNVIQNREQIKKMVESEKQQAKTTVVNRKKRNLLLPFFIASLLVNVFLLYQNLSSNSKIVEKEVVKEVPGPVQIKIVEKVVQLPSKPVDTAKIKGEVMAELANSFPAQSRIGNWQEELSRKENSFLAKRFSNPDVQERLLLKKLKSYVDFVNNILTPNQGKK